MIKVKAKRGAGRKTYYAPGNRVWIISPYNLEAVEVEVQSVERGSTPMYDQYKVIYVQNMLHGSNVQANVCSLQIFPDKAAAEKAIIDGILTSSAEKAYKAERLRAEASRLLCQANLLFAESVMDYENLLGRQLTSDEAEKIASVAEKSFSVAETEDGLKKLFQSRN